MTCYAQHANCCCCQPSQGPAQGLSLDLTGVLDQAAASPPEDPSAAGGYKTPSTAGTGQQGSGGLAQEADPMHE